VLDAAMSVKGKAKPKPGDFSVCIYCGIFLRFNDDMTIRAMDLDELQYLSASNVRKLMLIRELVKKRNEDDR
jgi:hypothetical protein